MSSSTSYYTNSPSPPQPEEADAGAGFQHSTEGAATMAGKLDELTRRVQQLERTLHDDVRTILAMLQTREAVAKEADGEGAAPEAARSRHAFQRSASEPKPISRAAQQQQQHSAALHRFASFGRGFEFEQAETAKEDKAAPIAKLESLDELDLVGSGVRGVVLG